MGAQWAVWLAAPNTEVAAKDNVKHAATVLDFTKAFEYVPVSYTHLTLPTKA